MNKPKRHAGRAIRKQRREQREMLATVAAIDWDAVWDSVIAAFAEFGRAIAQTAETMGNLMIAFADSYIEVVQQEYRMTHRALTTGHEVSA